MASFDVASLKQEHLNMLLPVIARDTLRADVLFAGYRGSIAHGMFVPSTDPDSIDDVDFMAVVVPPLDHYFGLHNFGSRGTFEYQRDATDLVAYEVRKFISLLRQGNPNVLTALWLRPSDIFIASPEWDLLMRSRGTFVGRHVYESFTGYAHAQIQRMTRGEGAPHRGFNGSKRAELRARFGYDPKNAAHAIRLLRMGVEFLRTGEFQVYRPDAAELLSIKRGEWTLDAVSAEAERLFRSVESCAGIIAPARAAGRGGD